MSSNRKARLATSTHMSNLKWIGRKMLPSEFPTLCDVLYYRHQPREKSRQNIRNYRVITLLKDIYLSMFEQWERAISSFAVTILNSRVTDLKKIEGNWEKDKNISLGRGKLEVKDVFIATLDKLFHIFNSKCEIRLWSEFESSLPGNFDSQHEVYNFCYCSKDMKILVKELMLINSQREKVRSVKRIQKQQRCENGLRRISECK